MPWRTSLASEPYIPGQRIRHHAHEHSETRVIAMMASILVNVEGCHPCLECTQGEVIYKYGSLWEPLTVYGEVGPNLLASFLNFLNPKSSERLGGRPQGCIR